MARTGIDQGDAYVRQLLNGSSPQLYKWRSALGPRAVRWGSRDHRGYRRQPRDGRWGRDWRNHQLQRRQGRKLAVSPRPAVHQCGHPGERIRLLGGQLRAWRPERARTLRPEHLDPDQDQLVDVAVACDSGLPELVRHDGAELHAARGDRQDRYLLHPEQRLRDLHRQGRDRRNDALHGHPCRFGRHREGQHHPHASAPTPSRSSGQARGLRSTSSASTPGTAPSTW
jgi:hypothetical protein